MKLTCWWDIEEKAIFVKLLVKSGFFSKRIVRLVSIYPFEEILSEESNDKFKDMAIQHVDKIKPYYYKNIELNKNDVGIVFFSTIDLKKPDEFWLEIMRGGNQSGLYKMKISDGVESFEKKCQDIIERTTRNIEKRKVQEEEDRQKEFKRLYEWYKNKDKKRRKVSFYRK